MFFLELDKINYPNLKESLIKSKKDFECSVVEFLDENILTVEYRSYPFLYAGNLFLKIAVLNFS